jgi:hypothetical protein
VRIPLRISRLDTTLVAKFVLMLISVQWTTEEYEPVPISLLNLKSFFVRDFRYLFILNEGRID